MIDPRPAPLLFAMAGALGMVKRPPAANQELIQAGPKIVFIAEAAGVDTDRVIEKAGAEAKTSAMSPIDIIGVWYNQALRGNPPNLTD